MAVITDPNRWLRHVVDGTIYPYSDLLAENPKVVEVSYEEAFPEKVKPANKPKNQKASKARAEAKEDLQDLAEQVGGAAEPEDTGANNAELNREASQGA